MMEGTSCGNRNCLTSSKREWYPVPWGLPTLARASCWTRSGRPPVAGLVTVCAPGSEWGQASLKLPPSLAEGELGESFLLSELQFPHL